MGAPDGRLTVRTSRSGLGSRAGHDLIIEAERWQASVTVARDGAATIEAVVDANSLTIREALGGLKPMTASDRKTTEKNMRKILQPDRYPKISFVAESTTVEDTTVRASGELTLLGVPQQLVVSGTLDSSGHVQAESTVTQSRWGITPFSAFFGALRLADDVVVRIDAPLVPSSPPE